MRPSNPLFRDVQKVYKVLSKADFPLILLPIMPIESGHTYYITNVENKNALDVSGTDPEHVSIIGWPYQHHKNQQWIFESVPDLEDTYTIRNVLYEKYVGYGDPLEPGTNVIATVETAVRWAVVIDQDEDSQAYRISVPGQELYLTLPSNERDTPVVLEFLFPDKSQFWEIRPVTWFPF